MHLGQASPFVRLHRLQDMTECILPAQCMGSGSWGSERSVLQVAWLIYPEFCISLSVELKKKDCCPKGACVQAKMLQALEK